MLCAGLDINTYMWHVNCPGESEMLHNIWYHASERQEWMLIVRECYHTTPRFSGIYHHVCCIATLMMDHSHRVQNWLFYVQIIQAS